MDNQRLLIWALFGLMAWFSYQAWQQDYGPRPEPPPSAGSATPELPDASALPELLDDTLDSAATPGLTDAPGVVADVAGPTIKVTTDVLQLEINPNGGSITRATLLAYPVAKDRPDVLVELLTPEADQIGLIRTGLRGSDGRAPDRNSLLEAPNSDYTLGDGQEIVVPLRWSSGDGVEIEKRFRFRRGSYAIGVEQQVTNAGDTEWRGDAYAQIVRRWLPRERSMFDVDSYSYDGPVIYDGEGSDKLDRDDLINDGPYEFKADNGWLAAIQHHFLSAVVPERNMPHVFKLQLDRDLAIGSIVTAPQSLTPGTSHTFSSTLFIGPKLQAQLEQVDKSLKLTVDYGWLTIISQPLFWLLSKIHNFVGNWGVAIILVTILIKLAFYKLTEASGRSMAKMRNLQPRLKALQERYKDDRQQLSQAMMELYKREQVNPAAGCLPILIQMPFFLAFYWVLLESVEMRQAPFALWISDLSSRDPYFILPLIMGAAMFFQQKLNPQVGDPVQVKVMQIMPVMFTAFFAFFPSGLVLYWVTNTLLSIAQQWKINTVVEQEAKVRRPGKKSRQKEGDNDSS